MDLHCKMNHIPFSALIRMAESGHINKRLAKVKDRIPVCLSCTFGMSHWRPWRSKGKPGTIRREDEIEPGVCVSVDQLVSAQPGLIPQMSGYLTNLRIWGATVFVDHFSDYVYVALMRDLSLDETLNAKTSFERHADQGGTSIQKYRADNGRFADKGFQDAVKNSNKKSHIVQWAPTTKMALRNEKSNPSPSLHGPSSFTHFVTGKAILQQ